MGHTLEVNTKQTNRSQGLLQGTRTHTYMVEGNWIAYKKLMCTWGEHTNSTSHLNEKYYHWQMLRLFLDYWFTFILNLNFHLVINMLRYMWIPHEWVLIQCFPNQAWNTSYYRYITQTLALFHTGIFKTKALLWCLSSKHFKYFKSFCSSLFIGP